jgi:hypothetical protein
MLTKEIGYFPEGSIRPRKGKLYTKSAIAKNARSLEFLCRFVTKYDISFRYQEWPRQKTTKNSKQRELAQRLIERR